MKSVAAALADVTGPGVDRFVQLKQADGCGSVVVFGQVAGGRRSGQIGKVEDGSVCKVLSIDEQSESYCIARCQSGWHCNTDVRDGWIAARNALVMMPDDAVQQADEGAAATEWEWAEADVMVMQRRSVVGRRVIQRPLAEPFVRDPTTGS